MSIENNYVSIQGYSKNVHKYLNQYSEPESQLLSVESLLPFDSILVIPVYNESISAMERFLNYESSRDFALVLVFNVPDVESPRSDQLEAKNNTISTLNILRSRLKLIDRGAYEEGISSKGNPVYVIDRISKPIPHKQGVGLARKIGLDFALNLCVRQYHECGRTVSWIHSTDADVKLPERYFERLDTLSHVSGVSAAVYPFKHIPEPGFELAMSLYEFSLRYYVEQLALAGSPYAFHTIGSLIVVSAEAYAAVRGIPKRAAGEDFYLLNKIAKVGKVHNFEGPEMIVAGRPSDRVPFGTGPALSKIHSFESPLKEYSFYHPRIFALLGDLLTIIAEAKQSFASAELLFEAIESKIPESAEANAVIDALKELKIVQQFEHLHKKSVLEDFQLAFHTWFDAFVTLRFIHIMRDMGFSNIPLESLDASCKRSFRELVSS